VAHSVAHYVKQQVTPAKLMLIGPQAYLHLQILQPEAQVIQLASPIAAAPVKTVTEHSMPTVMK